MKKKDPARLAKLTPLQRHVTQEKGTERAFSGEFWDHKEEGNYVCICCGERLFDSEGKFDSGCGWPSFFREAENAKIEEIEDRSHGMVRTEIVCASCGAHLGHVFDDGPAPTGLRYCVNSASLEFDESEQKS